MSGPTSDEVNDGWWLAKEPAPGPPDAALIPQGMRDGSGAPWSPQDDYLMYAAFGAQGKKISFFVSEERSARPSAFDDACGAWRSERDAPT